MRFSQRIGQVPQFKEIQLEVMDTDLRNSLWNILKIAFLDGLEKYVSYSRPTVYSNFCKSLWINFFKLPIDTLPESPTKSEAYIRDRFYKFQWYEVYDFIEFVANQDQKLVSFDVSEFKEFCNVVLEKENSAYRFIDDYIGPITNSTEISEIEDAIEKSGQFSLLRGVNTHLKNALDKLADRKNPDYRNSIKESISAVESLAKKISDNESDTLGNSLDKIKKKTRIHPALEKGFKQIYGYTSDESGIRHALTSDTTCEFEDAKFMLVSCSAFINYLIAKANKAGIRLNK